MIKRLLAVLVALGSLSMLFAIEKSTTIVHINGAKYYIHTVAEGETLYALAQTYEVTEQAITDNNESTSEGLKVGDRIKIPFVETKAMAKARQRAERKLSKNFTIHYVEKEETLYSIARRYEIAVQTLLADNPDLDPMQLRSGERILVRKTAIGTSSEREMADQLEDYSQQMNSVAPDGELFYVVQKGDTFYSLARKHGITEQQISELNDGLQPADLKAGAILRLSAGEATPSTDTTAEQVSTTPTEEIVAQHFDFRTQCDCDPMPVALLLPLGTPIHPNTNFTEFYRGFLMGLDSVRTRYGHSIELNVFNTNRDTAVIRTIVDNEAFRRSQLIVGPIYEEEMGPVVRFAEQKQVPIVSPLAQMHKVQSDALFEMAPDPNEKYAKAEQLIDTVQHITLIYTDKTDANFEAEMLELLRDRPYKKHTYRYVHPSTKYPAGVQHPSDLAPIMTNDDSNLYIIMADNEIDVDRVLAALASAETNLRARSLAKPRYTVLGNSRWNRYSNIDRTLFFRNSVVFFSTYHAKRNDQVIRNFDRAHIRRFAALPSLYTYRGYDAAMIFVEAMYNDIIYDLEDRRYEPLSTIYRFEQEHPTANHRNNNWMRINYNKDFTISIE